MIAMIVQYSIYQIQLIITNSILMSKLVFKMMAHSYCRFNQQNLLIQDCLHAISTRINFVAQKIQSETKQIEEVLSINTENEPEMSIIMQETQRSVCDKTNYEQWMSQVKDSFDQQIKKLYKVEKNADKLVNIYKNQLLDMSKQMTKFQKQQQDMKSQIKKIKQQKKQLQTQISQLKDQITSQTAFMLMQDNQEAQSIFDAPQKQNEPNNSQLKLNYTQPIKYKPVQPIQRTKPNSRKTSHSQHPGNEKANKKDDYADVVQIRVHSEKQMDEDLHKWKKLSKKIEDLKLKLVMYEDEISDKDQLIQKLSKTIKQYEISISNQGKKLKAANTTLRGQKTVMTNQINSLKKQISSQIQLCNAKDIQIQQLKIKSQNSQAVLKWQNSTIDELRTMVGKSQQRYTTQAKDKVNKLVVINEQLYDVICRQQKQLNEMDEKSKEIEEMVGKKVAIMQDRIQQLEMILDQKNQYIVKMKTKGPGIQNTNYANNSNGYLNQLVRVLTKKVADRDEVIRRLQMTK